MFEGYRPHIKAAQEGKPLEFPASLGEEPFTTSETLFRTIQYLAEVQKETSESAPTSVQGSGTNSKLLTRLLQRHIASFRKIVKEIDEGVDDGLPSDDETGDVELDYVRDLLESYDTTISWLKTWEPTILSGGLRRAIRDRPDQHRTRRLTSPPVSLLPECDHAEERFPEAAGGRGERLARGAS